MAKKKTTKKRVKKNPVGRPRTVFTTEQMNKMQQLALNGCMNNTIATIMDIPKETLVRNCGHILTKKRCERKNNLRRLQMQSAKKGNPALLIFLGKNELGQADKQEVEHSGEVGLTGLLATLDGQSRGLPNE